MSIIEFLLFMLFTVLFVAPLGLIIGIVSLGLLINDVKLMFRPDSIVISDDFEIMNLEILGKENKG